MDFVSTPSATYVVDIMRDRSAESAAASKWVDVTWGLSYELLHTRAQSRGLRGVLTSIAVAGILPMIETVGVAATYTLAALVAWVGCMYVCFVSLRLPWSE